MATFFTADTHYFHTKSIDFCNRPFSSVEEMNETMIYNHNYCVSKTDDVYFLGDFCWGTTKQAESILARLNGHKTLVVGNHDKQGRKAKGWQHVCDYKRIKIAQHRIILSHFPMLSWHGMHKGSIMLHGHCHGSLRPLLVESIGAPLIDVGVDVFDYKPVEAHHIFQLIMFRKMNNQYLGARVDSHVPGLKGDDSD